MHVIVIPKNRDGLTMLSKAREDQKGILGHLLYVAKEVGKKECPSGFRIVINDGEHGAQSVYHLHLHVIGKIEMHYLYLQSFGTGHKLPLSYVRLTVLRWPTIGMASRMIIIGVKCSQMR